MNTKNKMWFSKKRCKIGTHRKGKKCVKIKSGERESGESKLSSSLECKVDGTKKYCGKDKPLKPMISRPGGKRQLADKIVKSMKPHDTFVEPFLGGGAVFLNKPLAKNNVINDKDKEVITVFRAFKNKVGFEKCDMRASRSRFYKILKKKKKSACDVAYLNKLSFGGQNKTYAISKTGSQKNTFKKRFPKRKDLGIKYQKEHAGDYKNKLKNTKILNEDFEKVMKKYDGKKTQFYLDPPYLGTEDIYKEHEGVSPKRVCDTVKKMKGKVLVSYNDHKEVKKACKGLYFKKVTTYYSQNSLSENRKGNKELLIANYPI